MNYLRYDAYLYAQPKIERLALFIITHNLRVDHPQSQYLPLVEL